MLLDYVQDYLKVCDAQIQSWGIVSHGEPYEGYFGCPLRYLVNFGQDQYALHFLVTRRLRLNCNTPFIDRYQFMYI